MFTAFVIGNIASGKSYATRYLESRGGFRIDLDELSKELYIPGSDLVLSIADEFGWDVLDENGAIRPSVLAERAFETPERSQALNDLVYPVLIEQLGLRLLPAQCCSVMVPEHAFAAVEISVAASFTEAFGLADEIIAITAPLEVRRERAIARGMDPDDFDARAACQPSEEELCSLATLVIDNTAADDSLVEQLDAWLLRRGLVGGTGSSHE